MIEVRPAVLETRRFGVSAIRASGAGADLKELRRMALDHEALLVIVRCSAEDVTGIHALEAQGARLMDSHLSYERPVPRPGEPLPVPPMEARAATPADAEAVAVLARDAFADYGGHFHADPRLVERAPDAYVDWAERSVLDRAVADVVLLSEDSEGLEGFTTLRIAGEEGTGVLDAVATRARGRGVYLGLGAARLAEAARRGARRLVVRTHLVNLPARRGLARLGFLPTAQEHTFHMWLDDVP